MASKEELIKWMLEKRQNLTFEDKVQLIWEYWENRDIIPKLKEEIATKNQELLNCQKEIKDLEKNVEVKDNRILFLADYLKNCKSLLEQQLGYLEKLGERLKEERNKNKDNQEYQEHLREDLKETARERKALAKALKDLTEQEKSNKQLRDKEILDLKEEIRELKKKLLTTEQELKKEKQWWDQWINSDEIELNWIELEQLSSEIIPLNQQPSNFSYHDKEFKANSMQTIIQSLAELKSYSSDLFHNNALNNYFWEVKPREHDLVVRWFRKSSRILIKNIFAYLRTKNNW